MLAPLSLAPEEKHCSRGEPTKVEGALIWKRFDKLKGFNVCNACNQGAGTLNDLSECVYTFTHSMSVHVLVYQMLACITSF